jgi:phospholipase/carboxylesterase
MAQPTLSGPRVAPASGGPAKQLVVFLHGVGADGNDLIAFAPYFAEQLPDAAFVAPNAPFAFDMAAMGYQWFSLADTAPQAILHGIQAAAPILDAYVDQTLAELALTDRQMAVVGFSQGTMMALYVLLRRVRPCASLVGYSGMLAGPELLPSQLKCRPRVLLAHGEADDVVPYGYLPLAKSALEQVGVPVLTLSRPGLGHGIDEQGVIAGIDFVVQGFGEAGESPGG